MVINEIDENLVLEIKGLIRGVDNFKDDMTLYCELVKQLFLTGSSKN